MARRFGGYILVFHDLPADAYVKIIEALGPETPLPLCELLERQASGKSTAGLFAITVDDGVGETVRTLAAASIERRWPISFFLPTGYLDKSEDMLFMRWRKVLPHLAGTVVPLRSGTVDLSDPRDFKAFVRNMRQLRHTRPPEEHGAVVMECVEYAVNAGLATRAELEPPLPVLWSDVAKLSRTEFVSFESHGVTHAPVAALSEVALTSELVRSRERVAVYTGRMPRCFAYPFGGASAIGETAPGIVACHYDWALTMRRGRLRNARCESVPRIPMYAADLMAMVVHLKVLTAK